MAGAAAARALIAPLHLLAAVTGEECAPCPPTALVHPSASVSAACLPIDSVHPSAVVVFVPLLPSEVGVAEAVGSIVLVAEAVFTAGEEEAVSTAAVEVAPMVAVIVSRPTKAKHLNIPSTGYGTATQSAVLSDDGAVTCGEWPLRPRRVALPLRETEVHSCTNSPANAREGRGARNHM